MTWDSFFWYGQQSIAIENENDLNIGLLQPQRSFLYNRQDSVGIRENVPTGFTLYIMLRYLVAKWVAYRNNYVTRGDSGSRDRRIAVSQDSIGVDFIDKNAGAIDLNVYYINFIDYQKVTSIIIPFGE